MDINADGTITEVEYNEFRTMKAEEGGRRGPPPFCMFDSNKDDSITLEEFMQNFRSRFDPEAIFKEIDKNADGFISEQELSEHKPQRRNNRKNK
ncbi:MAG: EF-hand domain-containing protein [Gammaproteobacteria bacterium]|nr:EF-hand domain-containing protein [Gammaproteobacteria bacterium]